MVCVNGDDIAPNALSSKNSIQSTNSDDSHTRHATNEYVLNVAFFSFLAFLVTQGVFAVIAHSESMMADSMAMSVDAFTYLFNLMAERLKHRPMKFIDGDVNLPIEEKQRRRKMVRLYLEFGPPLISVVALVVVSLSALADAISTIQKEQGQVLSDEESNEGEPNVHLMLFFSALNLALDVLNVTCFAKVRDFGFDLPMLKKKVMMYFVRADRAEDGKTVESSALVMQNDDDFYAQSGISIIRKSTWTSESGLSVMSDSEVDGLLENRPSTVSYGGRNSKKMARRQKSALTTEGESCFSVEEESDDELLSCTSIDNGDDDNITSRADSQTNKECYNDYNEDNSLNLNMCSAYTHVMADTLRSIAVLIAAGIACIMPSLSPTLADASAAVAVSGIIAVSLGPLLMGLIQTWGEIRILHRL